MLSALPPFAAYYAIPRLGSTPASAPKSSRGRACPWFNSTRLRPAAARRAMNSICRRTIDVLAAIGDAGNNGTVIKPLLATIDDRLLSPPSLERRRSPR